LLSFLGQKRRGKKFLPSHEKCSGHAKWETPIEVPLVEWGIITWGDWKSLQGGEGWRFGRRLKSFGEKRNRRREREREELRGG
jgi:hypothetical protein